MPDSKVTELFLKQGYDHGPRQKQTKNFSRELRPQPDTMGFYPGGKKPKSPAREGFTIKKTEPTRDPSNLIESLHIELYPQERSTQTQPEIIKCIHIK